MNGFPSGFSRNLLIFVGRQDAKMIIVSITSREQREANWCFPIKPEGIRGRAPGKGKEQGGVLNEKAKKS